MPHVVSATYLDIQIARVSAILAAAWDAAPLELACPYFDYVTLALSYTRGAVGGAFDIQIWSSLYSLDAGVPAGGAAWKAESVYAGGILAAGADTQSRLQREFETYQATGAAIEAFTYGPIALAGTIERIRVRARESGDVQNLGTLQIQAQFASTAVAV